MGQHSWDAAGLVEHPQTIEICVSTAVRTVVYQHNGKRGIAMLKEIRMLDCHRELSQNAIEGTLPASWSTMKLLQTM